MIFEPISQVPRAGSILTYTGSEEKPSPLVLIKMEDAGKGVAVNLKTRENACVSGGVGVLPDVSFPHPDTPYHMRNYSATY